MNSTLGVIQSASGGDGTIIIEFEFPATNYWGSLQIGVQFEVLYDYVVYNKDNEVVNSETDKWWMNYSFCHYYFHVVND